MAEKSILITGCSSGIGECCARGLKERGWRVITAARKKDDLARLKDEGFDVVQLDYTKPSSIKACAEKTLELTDGKLGALFNNGGYGQPGAVEDVPTDALRAQFEANFFGWHDLTSRLLPAMRSNGGGRIVQNSSILGLVSLKYRGAYNASKFALEGLTDALRQELRGSGIHVSTIEPGPISSRFSDRALIEYKANIDLENSAHSEIYEARIAHMESGKSNLWERGPEAVLAKLVHALESRYPKPRYYVTFPTHALAFARRMLITRLLDLVTSNE
jgi:NAD(P)-dependent dehydrogenase (short-subunit alcohol dehydrogenase family)